jgi:hypothetical protein
LTILQTVVAGRYEFGSFWLIVGLLDVDIPDRQRRCRLRGELQVRVSV